MLAATDAPDCTEPHAEPHTLTVPSQTPADRLDKVLAALLPAHSRSRLQGWIAAGCVRVNGVPAKLRQRTGPGDEITVWPQPAPETLAFAPEPVDVAVFAESPAWIVVNKPAGLVTHPGAGNWRGTLLNGLLFRYPELAGVARAGIVHRLDKDTSGLLVVARTEAAQTHLVRQLQARTMGRDYLALAHGRTPDAGRIDVPVGRDARVPVRMSAVAPIAGKVAVTHYCALRRGSVAQHHRPVTELACRLETGRTHQIRAHLSALGHPLVGDTLYGGLALAGAARQMLHARALRFLDPRDESECAFEADPPADMQTVIATIIWQD